MGFKGIVARSYGETAADLDPRRVTSSVDFEPFRGRDVYDGPRNAGDVGVPSPPTSASTSRSRQRHPQPRTQSLGGVVQLGGRIGGGNATRRCGYWASATERYLKPGGSRRPNVQLGVAFSLGNGTRVTWASRGRWGCLRLAQRDASLRSVHWVQRRTHRGRRAETQTMRRIHVRGGDVGCALVSAASSSFSPTSEVSVESSRWG